MSMKLNRDSDGALPSFVMLFDPYSEFAASVLCVAIKDVLAGRRGARDLFENSRHQAMLDFWCLVCGLDSDVLKRRVQAIPPRQPSKAAKRIV
jgi:hypothetical protein